MSIFTETHTTVISPHQDVFSRFISGTGAPYWVLVGLGINPRRIHQTASGVLHSCWEKEGHGGTEGREEAKDGKQGEWPDSELMLVEFELSIPLASLWHCIRSRN